MSTTFKSWLVANFETVTGVVLLITLSIPFFWTFSVIDSLSEESEKTNNIAVVAIMIIFLQVVFPFAIASTPPKFAKSLIAYLLILGFCVFWAFIPYLAEKSDPEAFKGMTDKEMTYLRWLLFYPPLLILIVSSIPAFLIARYAHSNFDEVVSRRMLYRNSNVSLFEKQWKYTMDRFCSISYCIFDIIVAIPVYIIVFKKVIP